MATANHSSSFVPATGAEIEHVLFLYRLLVTVFYWYQYRVTHTSLLVPVFWYQLLVPETGQSDVAFMLSHEHFRFQILKYFINTTQTNIAS